MKYVTHLFFGALWLVACTACSSDKAQMELTYSPENAHVSIDGYTPSTYTSPHLFDFYKPGKYKLEVSAPGYKTVSMMIEIRTGHILKEEVHLIKVHDQKDTPNTIAVSPSDTDTHEPPAQVELGPSPLDFLLRVESIPQGATAILQTAGLNSVLVLKTPAMQLLRRHVPWQVEFQLEGYRSVKKTVIGPAGQDEVNLSVTLTPMDDNSSVQIPTVPPDAQVIAVEPLNSTIPVDSAPSGMLSVQSTPWTVVSVNGKVIGNTPIINYKLLPGTYKILMENRDLSKRKVQTITVRNGEHVRLEQEL